ncbi:MAG TPA: Hsp20/alpha crystallin family protein [Chloroflexota bacterium]|nr:Hsp20/alpha crystallin family protein [Chloroflexota bacterium]
MLRNYSLGDLYTGVPLRDLVEHLFSEARVMSRAAEPHMAAAPVGAPVNMYETDSDLLVVLPLPGVSPNDIEVEVRGTQLQVRTTTRRDEPQVATPDAPGAAPAEPRRHRWLRHEFRLGPYERTVELPYPVDPDRCDATYEHGLLALRFPRPATQRPRRIALESAGAPSPGTPP